jgi:ribosome recycling factor
MSTSPTSVGKRMSGAVERCRSTLAGLRIGRPSPELLSRITVDAYGSTMPLTQVAQVGVQLPRSLVVTPHDPQLAGSIERAIRDSDLGVNPSNNGVIIRIELPAPTQERREQLTKVAKLEAEEGRVAVRNIRRDTINAMRRAKSAGEISEAKLNGRSKDIQRLTDEHVAQIDALLAETLKEMEL